MILCRTHAATFPRYDQEIGAICWGHLEKVARVKSSTEVCDPYWVAVEWGEPVVRWIEADGGTDESA